MSIKTGLQPKGRIQAFHYLSFPITHISRHLHRITHEGVPTRMMYSCFVVYNVHCQSCSLSKRTELVVDRFDLNGVQWNERGLTCTLVRHILGLKGIQF